jgi:glycerol-3-phosphate dehydrogenase
MGSPASTFLDVAIVGGGIAALWLLDALDEAGFAAGLIEPGALGQGQTLASQGIIHGGLKYTLRGVFSPSADAISGMPDRWRRSLSGECRPDLRGAILRSPSTWMWRTESLRSQAALLGARAGLRTRPVEVATKDRPEVLARVPGTVYRVDEPVLDTTSLVRAFRNLHVARMLAGQGIESLRIDRDPEGFAISVATIEGPQAMRPVHGTSRSGRSSNCRLRPCSGAPCT